MKTKAEKLAALLLGAIVNEKSSSGCLVDNSHLVFFCENEDGYSDHSEPVVSSYYDEYSDPFLSLTMSDLDGAEVNGCNITVLKNGEWYTITPLTPLNVEGVLR